MIEVAAYSVNRGETFQVENPPADWRPGKDVAGRVVATVDGGPAIGSRVLAHVPHSGSAEHVTALLKQVAVLPGAPCRNSCGGVFTVRDGAIVAVREYADTDHVRRTLFESMP